MLYQIMAHIRNFFTIEGAERKGKFTIENGNIYLPFLIDGQYFKVEGSVFNDGVYKYPVINLVDEEFEGVIVPMAVPKDFIALAEEISGWNTRYGESAAGPFKSESFGGYSYTKGSETNGGATSWKEAFRTKLNTWRKM